MTSYALKFDTTLETEECVKCGVVFAVPATLRRQWISYKTTFYCPNGHSMSYTKPELERTREMLEQANRRNTELAAQVSTARDAQAEAERQTKRIRSRVQRGVCTCCNRTFANLARHMATKHPAK